MATTAEERAKELNNSGASNTKPPKYSIGNSFNDGSTEGPVTDILIDPADFDETMKVKLLSSIDLCTMINSLFIPIFKDYYGCTVEGDPARPSDLMMSLYFCKGYNKKAGGGAIYNLIPVGSKKESTSIQEKINFINNTNKPSKLYKLSSETQDILMKYVFPHDKVRVGGKNGEPIVEKLANRRTINDYLVETTESNAYGYGYNVVDVIRGLNPLTAITEYYGVKNPEGDPVQYELKRINPIADANVAPVGNNPRNFLMAISQLNMPRTEQLWKNSGYSYSMLNQLPIVRV